MYKGKVRKHVFDQRNNNPSFREKEKQNQGGYLSSPKHLRRVYPIGIERSNSSFSLSSSLNSNDSSLKGSIILGDWKIPVRRPPLPRKPVKSVPSGVARQLGHASGDGSLTRCHWITKTTDEVYVVYHDESWGVPVYDDFQLFELLALSGMLMYHFWIEIIKRKDLYREAFSNFDPYIVAKMGEKEIKEISSNKALMLDESLVRCIVDNANSILKITMEYGSFSDYLWGYVNYKPMISRYRYAKSVPLRSPKAEVISRNLVRRGFRFVGPVIIHSFMQAAGMTNDHLIDCFRFNECVRLAGVDVDHDSEESFKTSSFT
ncbi:hypothetical protein MKW94_005484 [Papaver nudicaule]|uniref:DNA-3-methyladenine glycosylase I n=1 Tax=Papaver nudicaule TaxID=74823 RepID=A0AA41VWJ7_PAPNU|nr:hypothetical protein [Papaver nudicaule]